MTSPSLSLQEAVVAKLKADVSLTAIVSSRIYDRAPQNTTFPMVTIGDPQTIQDDAECIEAYEVYLDIHTWSRSVGKVEAQQINELIRKSLHKASLNLSGDLAFLLIEHETTRIVADPDGITTHGVVTFRALIEAA